MKLTDTALEKRFSGNQKQRVILFATALLAILLTTPLAIAQNEWATRPPTSTGPAVGQKIPAFRALDQNGKMQDFDAIKGPKGAAVYFMRSADW